MEYVTIGCVNFWYYYYIHCTYGPTYNIGDFRKVTQRLRILIASNSID